jgi:hypothetical protein
LAVDEAAAQRSRALLILPHEIVFADRAADALERLKRFPLWMQWLAAPPREGLRTLDRRDLMHLVFFGNCRKAHDLPVL